MTTRRPRTLPRAALALLFFLPFGPVAGFAPAAGPAITTAGTWRFNGLQPTAQRVVRTDVAETVPEAKAVLGLVDGSVTIDEDVALCPRSADSCAFPPAPGGPWRSTIHLSPDTDSGTLPSQRFYVLHEIGHAVWALILRDGDRAAFAGAVAGALDGRPCRRVRDGSPCAPITEIFADEFARWAGGFHANMTGYQTPSLLDAADMARVMDHALTENAQASP
jgi:hypothetical protein